MIRFLTLLHDREHVSLREAMSSKCGERPVLQRAPQ